MFAYVNPAYGLFWLQDTPSSNSFCSASSQRHLNRRRGRPIILNGVQQVVASILNSHLLLPPSTSMGKGLAYHKSSASIPGQCKRCYRKSLSKQLCIAPIYPADLLRFRSDPMQCREWRVLYKEFLGKFY
ncbi:hypothetical protein CEXT_518431 [Caerostris extrusa]|uniref:Uncharacterized protein n=1 Tax=Caerostris extrusa TaxID=172846 RepID=A0AAV4TWT2_CAEEX|nr:hypothetical protein CEXT_518431 [Caerostris extrusa]